MLFFGLLTFIFLQIIRPQDFVPGLEGTRLVLYLMVILLTGLLFSTIEKKLFRSPQDKFVGLFLGAIVLSTFAIFWLSYMMGTAIETLKIGLIYYFIIVVIDNEDRFKTVTWTMVVLMTIVGLMGVLQYHGYDLTGAGMGFAVDKGVWQIKGIGNFDNPNDLAYSVVFVVPFSLGLLFQAKGFLNRFVAITTLGISLYCIYLTRSRGGQIAFGACLMTWLYFWTPSRKWKRRMLIVAAIGLFAIFSVRTAGYREDASAMGRIEAWSDGWQLLKNHPIIGAGKDQFREYHERDSHSSYVRAGAELGLIGLYAFVGILYYSGLTLFEVQRSPKNIRWRMYYAGFASFLSSYVVASIFSTRTYDLIFLLCVALISVLGGLSLKGTDVISAEGVLFRDEGIIRNKNVFGLTIAVLIAWYLFLRQVW